MTADDSRMNPVHFGSDLADILVQINLEIRIQIKSRIRDFGLTGVCSLLKGHSGAELHIYFFGPPGKYIL